MIVDSFLAANLGSSTLAVTAAAQTLAIPRGNVPQTDLLKSGGMDLLITNTAAAGGVIIYVEVYSSANPVVATVAGSMPVLPGTQRIVRRGSGDDTISAIGSAAGPTNLVITVGTGL